MWPNWIRCLVKKEHHLHGQTWRRSSLVMGVLCCRRKWKSWLCMKDIMNSLKYQAILEKMVIPSVQKLKLDDQWSFLQDSDPKVHIQIYWSLVQASVVEHPRLACTVFRFKSHWKYLVEFEESSDNVKTKDCQWSGSFFYRGMGQDCSWAVTEASKHLKAAFIGGCKE